MSLVPCSMFSLMPNAFSTLFDNILVISFVKHYYVVLDATLILSSLMPLLHIHMCAQHCCKVTFDIGPLLCVCPQYCSSWTPQVCGVLSLSPPSSKFVAHFSPNTTTPVPLFYLVQVWSIKWNYTFDLGSFISYNFKASYEM